MYNRLFKYLSENSILYKTQFGFQAPHSTEHAILLLVNQLYQSFNESKFTLGIFIDLSKAFDTVDHKILTKKLELYGIKDCNLRWFESYLSNRKQFVFADDANLFCSHKNIKRLFQIVSSELKLVTEWLLAHKLSLNAKKNKVCFIS